MRRGRGRYLKVDPRIAKRRPALRVAFTGHDLVAELTWDRLEYIVTFNVIQAVRLTTVDAYPFTGSEPHGLTEVIESDWIRELAAVVAKTDKDADFMTRSHHYFLLGEDDVLEVAAFAVAVRPAS